MRIIQAGFVEENLHYIGICNHCKCKVEFSRAEAKVTRDQKDGDYVSISCPTECCGNKIHVAIQKGYYK